jgi:hypothetical protein
VKSIGNFLADLEAHYRLDNFGSIWKRNDQLISAVGIKQLASALGLGPSSEKKVKERIASRLQLAELLGLELPTQLDLLKFNEEFRLYRIPGVQCSLSHSNKILASVYSKKNNFFLGIDVEEKNRTIATEAKRLFAHKQDDLHENLLELWVKKEAAYKAIYHWQTSLGLNPDNKIKGLFEISVQDLSFSYKENLDLGKILRLENSSFQDAVCYLGWIDG